MATHTIVIYSLIIGWALFSIYYIYRLWSLKKVFFFVYKFIPRVFTILGVLGTCVGIYLRVQHFNADKIGETVPSILNGIETEFAPVFLGIVLSLIFRKISQLVT